MQILFRYDKQQHKNIMFLYITFTSTLITNPALPSPFPDQMLHRWDMKTFTSQDSNRQQTNSHTYTNDTRIRPFKNR